jgi:protein-disulfide isomerase
MIAGVAAVALIAAIAVYFFTRGPSATQTASETTPSGECKPSGKFEIGPRDVVMGSSDAPLTFIEYASMTCPHCAALHETVLPKIKEQYIDKGQLRFVFREFPLDQVALAASVLTRCVSKDAYYPFLSMLFLQQENWARATDIRASLKELSSRAGLNESEFDACLKNKAEAEAIVKTRSEGESMYCIGGTPTAVLNGRVLEAKDIADFETFDAQIRAELKKLGKPVPEPVSTAAPAAAAPTDAVGTNPAPNPADGPSENGTQPPSP